MAAVNISPVEWTATNTQASGTLASATRAAFPGIQHICRGIYVSAGAVSTTGICQAVLRDGLTGAGTILWQATLQPGVGAASSVHVSEMNIVGTRGNAMTLEFTAGVVGITMSVTLAGYDDNAVG